MKNLFRQFTDVYKEVINEEKALDIRNTEQVELVKCKKNLLDEIKVYISSYEWLTHKEYKDKVKFYLKNGFNLKLLAEHYGISDDAAKKSISYANIKLGEKIGKDTIKLIREGSIEEARRIFKLYSQEVKLEEILLDGGLEVLPRKGEFFTKTLKECDDEVKYLYLYSKALRDKRIQKLNTENLAFIKYLLTENTKLNEEKSLVLELLMGVLSFEDYSKRVKELEKMRL